MLIRTQALIPSPRQQGSGIVDTAAAVSTDLYVTGENGYQA